MEYSDDHNGEFPSLQYLPENKNIVLGLVASKSSNMENLEEIKAKVFAAAELVAEAQGDGATRENVLKRMGVSPTCGFASHHKSTAIESQHMIAKLNLVRTLADEVWPGEP